MCGGRGTIRGQNDTGRNQSPISPGDNAAAFLYRGRRPVPGLELLHHVPVDRVRGFPRGPFDCLPRTQQGELRVLMVDADIDVLSKVIEKEPEEKVSADPVPVRWREIRAVGRLARGKKRSARARARYSISKKGFLPRPPSVKRVSVFVAMPSRNQVGRNAAFTSLAAGPKTVERNSNNPRSYSKLTKCVNSWTRSSLRYCEASSPIRGSEGGARYRVMWGGTGVVYPLARSTRPATTTQTRDGCEPRKSVDLLVDILGEGNELAHRPFVTRLIDEHEMGSFVRLHPEKSFSKGPAGLASSGATARRNTAAARSLRARTSIGALYHRTTRKRNCICLSGRPRPIF